MTEDEYNVGYYLDMINVIKKTEKLIDQYHSVSTDDIKWSIMELIAIYYSKPFLKSKRSYTREDGSKRDQEVKLERNKAGKIIGFQSVSSYMSLPLLDFQLETLRSNLTKIKDHLWSRIYT